ncbi:hypothetical protein [Gordonia sp. NPDC003376]
MAPLHVVGDRKRGEEEPRDDPHAPKKTPAIVFGSTDRRTVAGPGRSPEVLDVGRGAAFGAGVGTAAAQTASGLPGQGLSFDTATSWEDLPRAHWVLR